MAYDLGTARGVIELEYNGRGAMTQAQGDVGSLTDKSSRAGAALNTAANVAGGAGLAIAAGLGAGVKAAADFEHRMSAIGAVSGATKPQMEALRAKALQLGKDTAFSADESAQAMEELIKAGLSVDDVLNGAADATVNLAAAGEVDMKTAATIASNAMNQFNIKAKDMEGVVNQIAGAANASAIDVTDFGESMKQVGAVANLAGVNFKDTATAIALMGNAGIKGSDAGTSLKSMLSRLQPTTKKAQMTMEDMGLIAFDAQKGMDVLRENGIKPMGSDAATVEKQLMKLAARLSGSKVGSEVAEKKFNDLALSSDVLKNKFYDAQGSTKGLAQISGVLAKATAGMTDKQKQMALQTLFGSDAIRAAAIMTEAGAKGFENMQKKMSKVTAAEVAEKRMDNLKGSMEELKGSFETVGITMGSVLLPMVRSVVDAVTGFLNIFLSMPAGMQKVVVVMLALTSAGLLMFAGMVKVMQGVKAARDALLLFRTILVGTTAAQNMSTAAAVRQKVVQLASAAATKAQAAAMAVIRGATVAWTAVQWLLNAALLANPIGLVVLAIVALIAIFVLAWKNSETFRKIVIGAWEAIKKASVVVWNVIKKVFTTVWNAIKTAVGAGIKFIKGVIKTGLNFIKGAWKAVWGVFGPIVKAVWGLIVAVIKLYWTIIKGLFLGAVKILKAIWDRLWGGIKKVVGTVWDAIKKIVGTAIDNVKNNISRVWNVIKSVTSNVWDAIKGAIDGPINAAKNVVSNVINTIKTIMGNVWGVIKGAVQNAWSAISGAVGNGVNNAVDKVQGLKDRVLGFFSGASRWLVDAGKNIIQGLIDGIASMINAVKDKVNSVTNAVGRFLPGSPVQEGPLKVLNRGKAGKQIVQMVIDGISNMARPLAGAMAGAMPMPVAAGGAGARPVKPPARGGRGGRGGSNGARSRLVSGTLRLDKSGRAFIRAVADDAVDDRDDFDGTRGRMG